MKKAALLSVSNRHGILEFAKALKELGYILLVTSGTGRYLKENGIDCTYVEDYTGQPEILDGRVKTLHPKIYSGILARRDNQKDMNQILADDVLPIDVVAVNLYPFSSNVDTGKSLDEMIELIDIGGPSMIRAASKNHKFVLPVIDPSDYASVISYLGATVALPPDTEDAFRKRLAVKVFALLARDCTEIASYFSRQAEAEMGYTFEGCVADPEGEKSLGVFPEVSGLLFSKHQSLRYGENPHQKACFYRMLGQSEAIFEQLGGKELSYNNLLDLDATVRMVKFLPSGQPAAVIVKHLNPCGASRAALLVQAIKGAKRCDPRSHFGGIIGCTDYVTLPAAEEVRGDFAEIIVAPSYSEDALQELRKSKNLRIIKYDFKKPLPLTEVRSSLGGLLVQKADLTVSLAVEAQVVSERKPTERELEDLQFAWSLCSHVKSNAITLVNGNTLVATGAGQMSRIDSVEVALAKAKLHGHSLSGAVAASDAFFPFPDSIETLAMAGITAIIAPAGAKRDADAIEAANRHRISLLFAPDRHFRH